MAAVGIGLEERAAGVRLFGCRLYLAAGDMVGGLTVFVPRRWVVPRWRCAVATAGGPAANALLALAAMLVWNAAGGRFWLCLGGVSLALGLFALLPKAVATPLGWVESDGLQLLRLFRPAAPSPLRPVALVRVFEPYRRVIGEPRLFALYSDLAAVERTLLGATEAAARCRADAEGNRLRWTNRLERAAAATAAGVLARAAGDAQSAADQLAEVRRLLPDDVDFQLYASLALADAPATDPWFRCWQLRTAAAAEADPGRAAALYREAVAAANEPRAGLGDHPDDWTAFVGAIDRLLLAYRRAVAASGGDPKQATRELLEPIYAAWRPAVTAASPAAPVAATSPDPAADRHRWGQAVTLAGCQLAVGVSLVGVALSLGPPGPVGRVTLAAGLAAGLWAGAVLLAAAAFMLLPGSRPGQGDTGRAMRTLAGAAAVTATAQAGVTGWWLATH